ncbi:MAG: hypothetical protein ACKVHP_23030, partial [Verrucomicrobiales bacterium]
HRRALLVDFYNQKDAGWPEDGYLFHPAMIDGVTQLAFVWDCSRRIASSLSRPLGNSSKPRMPTTIKHCDAFWRGLIPHLSTCG